MLELAIEDRNKVESTLKLLRTMMNPDPDVRAVPSDLLAQVSELGAKLERECVCVYGYRYEGYNGAQLPN